MKLISKNLNLVVETLIDKELVISNANNFNKKKISKYSGKIGFGNSHKIKLKCTTKSKMKKKNKINYFNNY